MTDKSTITSSHKTVIVWFRQDLRVCDHPALQAAVASGKKVVPVFILDDKAAGLWAHGGAQRWALHQALDSLTKTLGQKGAFLVLRQGHSLTVLRQLIKETGANEIVWNRRYEPWAVAQDKQIKEVLRADGLTVNSFNGRLLCEPWQIKNGQGNPYKVFTPYWKACLNFLQTHPVQVIDAPEKIPGVRGVTSDDLAAWKLLPEKPDWAGGLRQTWRMTEQTALEMLLHFIEQTVDHYLPRRDFPSEEYTSRLSPYLALGLIAPHRIWDAVQNALSDGRIAVAHQAQAEGFLRQIFWREFSYHLLFHFPQTAEQPLNPNFADFPWEYNDDDLRVWQKGMTGYPLVDAGMRQLWQTGWMHNRVRLVVASFLVKHLLLSWQQGAAWFWDTLVDADLANNTMGWQWTSGCGADAAPYFRIFNPVTQSEKFEAEAYIRGYVPELAALPDKYLHAPWTAPQIVLDQAGVVLGKTYPEPVIEHGFARHRALDALKQTQKD